MPVRGTRRGREVLPPHLVPPARFVEEYLPWEEVILLQLHREVTSRSVAVTVKALSAALPPFVLVALVASAPAAHGPADRHASSGFLLTALDEYVRLEDPSYAYDHYHTQTSIFPLTTTTYFLTMTSQTWRSEEEVDRPLWEHHLQIIVPSGPINSSAVQVVDGGSNLSSRPQSVSLEFRLLASNLRMVVAIVQQIPNQPLRFADEGDTPRSEDAVIAYSFDKYLRTRDSFWPALLPMTKAVVRSMDTVQTFLADQSAPIEIDDFIVVGASKRGWTSYLTAAVDDRVRGVVPVSIDFLSTEFSLNHHWDVYGFYAPPLNDYAGFDLFCRMPLEDPGRSLLRIVDPHRYRQRLTMPKLIVNSTGDQFFVPTSSRFYFQQLPGPKHLRYVVNADHDPTGDPTVVSGVLGWIQDLRDGKDLPEFSWTLEEDGSIRVEVETSPQDVRLWQATNPEVRDFRLLAIGPAWTPSPLEEVEEGVYIARVEPPESGFTAFLVELDFGGGHIYTTEVAVTPDVLPFQGSHCNVTTYFPHVADGRLGDAAFRTSLNLVNAGPSTRLKLEFFQSDGTPMTLNLGPLGTSSAFEIPLKGGESFSARTSTEDTGVQVGYARMTAGNWVGGTAVFSRIDGPTGVVLSEAGVPSTAPLDSFALFVDSLAEKDTGVALVNAGETEARLTLRLYDTSFTLLAEDERVLDRGHHEAKFIFELFPGLAGAAGEMQGILTFHSDQPVVVLTLRTRDDSSRAFPERVPILTTLPVVPGPAAP